MGKIVFTGDSNTAEYYVSRAQSFAKQAGTALGYSDAEIINTAIPGYYTEGIRSNLSAMVLNHSPACCVLMIGTNDVANAYENNIPNSTVVSGYISTMAQIIDGIKAAGIKLLVVSPPMSQIAEQSSRFPALVSALAELCIDKGVGFLDINARMARDAKNNAAVWNQWFLGGLDKYHLSATGHSRVADCIVGSQLLAGAGVSPPIEPPTTATGNVLNQALSGSFGNIDTKTIRCRIKAAQLTPPTGSVTKFRLTLQGHADEPLALAKCYLGIKSGSDACDAASLAPVKVSGSSEFTVPAGAQVVSDWIDLSWNKTTDLILSFYANGGASSDKLASASGTAAGDTYLKNGDEAAVADVTGFSEYLGYLSLVTKIETDGF